MNTKKNLVMLLKMSLCILILASAAESDAQSSKKQPTPKELFLDGIEKVSTQKEIATGNSTISFYKPKKANSGNYQFSLYRIEDQYGVVNNERTLINRRVSAGSHVLMTLNEGYNRDDITNLFSSSLIGSVRRIGNTETYIVPVNSPSLNLIEQLSNTFEIGTQSKLQFDRMIKYIEYDDIVFADVIPNDVSFGELWGMHNTGQNGGTVDADIDAVEAWDRTTGNSSIIVGVIDTGIDYQHPDLSNNSWTNTVELNGTAGVDDDGNGYIDDIKGWNFYANNNNPLDDNGHGTHVAGTIGARGNNGIGVAGVAWNVRMVAIKFLSASGSGSTSGAIGSVDYSNNIPGILLTNNSWGGGSYSQALKDEIDEALSKDILFISSAGNSGLDNDIYLSYPASYASDNIISVAATDRNDNLAGFSNIGKTTVDVGAPGVDIYSTWPGATYKSLNGTSMASPHVAGACVLVKAVNPTHNYSQIKQKILSRGDKITALNGKVLSGKRLNANQSLEIIPATDMPVGGVISFFGNEAFLPENWVVCDGKIIVDSSSPLNGQVAPDLRGRFVRGPDSVYPANSTGGIDGIPSHSHYFSDRDNNVFFPLNSGTGWSASWHLVTAATNLRYDRNLVALNHPKQVSHPYPTHGHMNGVADIDGFTLETGGHDNKPRFYSLIYIMKIK